MRLRPALLTAATAAAFGPAALRAQASSGPGFGQFIGRGCGTGFLSDDPLPGVTGTVVCFVGTFTFTYLPNSGTIDLDQIRLDGVIEPTFNPDLRASSLNSNGGILYGQYPNSRCADGVCRGILSTTVSEPSLRPGVSEPFAVRGFGTPLRRTDDLSRAMVDSVRFFYDYALPRTGPGYNTQITLTFSAVPEPSTFALAAAGGVFLAAGAVARRRRSA
jgi:hypothetical protein